MSDKWPEGPEGPEEKDADRLPADRRSIALRLAETRLRLGPRLAIRASSPFGLLEAVSRVVRVKIGRGRITIIGDD